MNFKSLTKCAATLVPGVAETIETKTGHSGVVISRNMVYIGATLTALSLSEVAYPRKEGNVRRSLYGAAAIASIGLTIVAAAELFKSVCK